jgi:hypothetical protein
MRQLVCMSADVYCQILNNHRHENRHIYTQTERRGNGLDPRETERECVRDGEWLKVELVSVVKTAVGERLTISG